jgi:hypothetical protein
VAAGLLQHAVARVDQDDGEVGGGGAGGQYPDSPRCGLDEAAGRRADRSRRNQSRLEWRYRRVV